MKLLKVDTVTQAQEKLYNCIKDKTFETEIIDISCATGRFLACDVISKENIPSFYRSTVDGYAVKSADTQAATENIPVFLKILEDISIGEKSNCKISNGECAYVPTGGMLPKGADAVVMVEYTENFDKNSVAIYDAVSYQTSVVVPGEDVMQGELVLKKGTRLTCAQIGVLAAMGFWQIEVFKPLKVSIISTGDEIVEVTKTPIDAQVRDVNTWSLKALALQYGIQVVKTEKLKDDKEKVKTAIMQAIQHSDIVLTSGGSSQGKKDMTENIFDEITDGGVFTHGLSLKPGKPTILAFDKKSESILIGLPGHPVAALTVFEIMVANLWQKITGAAQAKPIIAQIEYGISSAAGKTTCLLVQLIQEQNGYIAKPILGKSGLINTMVQADGYIIIDMNKEGLQKGETVYVHRFGGMIDG